MGPPCRNIDRRREKRSLEFGIEISVLLEIRNEMRGGIKFVLLKSLPWFLLGMNTSSFLYSDTRLTFQESHFSELKYSYCIHQIWTKIGKWSIECEMVQIVMLTRWMAR